MTNAIILATLLIAVNDNADIDGDNDPRNACFEAYDTLSQVDASYLTTMQGVCDTTMRSATYWKCVKSKVKAGATPAYSTEHCDEE